MTLSLTLPMPPTLTNSGRGRSRHWRAQHAERNAYWELLDNLQLAGRIPAPPAAAIARATIRSTMHLGAAMDDDNAIARHKRALDWLVTRGYLKSDRRSCLRWEGLPEQHVRRDGNYRLELTITPQE